MLDERWDLDLTVVLVFVLSITIWLASMGQPFSGMVLPLAAFVVTIELGVRLPQRNYFPSWVWMSIGGALVFTLLFGIVFIPAKLAYYHYIDPRASIPQRLVKLASREFPLLLIPFALWSVPALISTIAVRFFSSLAAWLLGSRINSINPVKALVGLTLLATTFSGAVVITRLFV